VDASQDVQRSVQDIKDALRECRLSQQRIEEAIEELKTAQREDNESIREKLKKGSFTEFKEDVVFLGDVIVDGGTFGGASHGDLSDLGVDDHTQYILADCTRALAGVLIPDGDGTRDLGSSGASFNDLYLEGNAIGLKEERGATLQNTTSGLSADFTMVFRAYDGYTVDAIYCWREGGTGATVNVRKNGSSDLRSTDLSVASASTWTAFGTLQNNTLVANDYLEVEVASVTGTVTLLSWAFHMTRA